MASNFGDPPIYYTMPDVTFGTVFVPGEGSVVTATLTLIEANSATRQASTE